MMATHKQPLNDMPTPHPPRDLFDRLAAEAQATPPWPPAQAGPPAEGGSAPTDDASSRPERTPMDLRRAVQELLRHGWLEQASKPRLYRTVSHQTAQVNRLLEPLDLEVALDEVRGLAFVRVVADYSADGDSNSTDEDADGWSHPLVFRQRLTLEQSLLVAILRREFTQQEQEGGLGVAVRLAVDDVLPQLDVFIARSGSETQDHKRLMQLLDNLRKHGVVSEVDAQDRFLIRPMIVHLANPENLQALLLHLRALAHPANGTDQVAADMHTDNPTPTEAD